MRHLYTLLLSLLTPLIVLRLLIKSRQLLAYRQRIGERFAFLPAGTEPVAVWVHAVSVGESLAALPMIEALVSRHGAGRVWVSTTTPTGSERIQAALGDRVRHSYAPYDLPGVVARFLDRVRPGQVVVMETELWPNLFHQLRQRDIPLTIANARLSPRSFAGYGRVPGFTRSVLQCVTTVAAQSPLDAERFLSLGAPDVLPVGNIKFDVSPPAAEPALVPLIRSEFSSPRPIWIAASTHQGEEDVVLQAHDSVRKLLPACLLILVPRHPQRFDEVARGLERRGTPFIRRSALVEGKAGLGQQAAVLLGDSMGEMWGYLMAAQLAFVGGSLVPVGGHNVLEPAALALPVLFGPEMHNFLAARDLLLGSKAAEQIADAASLAEAVTALLGDASRRRTMGAAGAAAVEANRGALQRLLQLLAGPDQKNSQP